MVKGIAAHTHTQVEGFRELAVSGEARFCHMCFS